MSQSPLICVYITVFNNAIKIVLDIVHCPRGTCSGLVQQGPTLDLYSSSTKSQTFQVFCIVLAPLHFQGNFQGFQGKLVHCGNMTGECDSLTAEPNVRKWRE